MSSLHIEASSPRPKTGQLSWILDSGLITAAAVSIVSVVIPAGLWLHRSQNPDMTVVALAIDTDPDRVESLAGPTGSPLMWMMKDADSTVYLFGAPGGAVTDAGLSGWMDQRLFGAFDSADWVVFEAATYPQSRPGEKASPLPEAILFHRARHLEKQTVGLGGAMGLDLPMTAWRTGDQKTLTDALTLQAGADPARYKALMARNDLWAPKVERLLDNEGVTFVTVSASHLIGPDGLVRQLRQRGRTLTRLDAIVKP